MALSKTQIGAAGEHLFCAVVILGANGLLELYRPVSDDDHTDVVAGRKGRVPNLAIQVKTVRQLDKNGLLEARATFNGGVPRDDSALLYAILHIPHLGIEKAWIMTSTEFNREAYRTTTATGATSLSVRIDPMATANRIRPELLAQRIHEATTGARVRPDDPPPPGSLLVFA